MDGENVFQKIVNRYGYGIFEKDLQKLPSYMEEFGASEDLVNLTAKIIETCPELFRNSLLCSDVRAEPSKFEIKLRTDSDLVKVCGLVDDARLAFRDHESVIGVKSTYLDGTVYEGSFVKNKYTGEGRIYYPNGSFYEGGFVDGLYNGEGKLSLLGYCVYEGRFQDGEFGDDGKLTLPDGTSYKGGFENGVFDGWGVLIYPDGVEYEGDFEEGEYDGYGVLSFPDGTVYDGEFSGGVYDGEGKYTFKNGTVYEGFFECGVFAEYGKLTLPNGVEYEGEFDDDSVDGDGVLTLPDGSVYERDEDNEFPEEIEKALNDIVSGLANELYDYPVCDSLSVSIPVTGLSTEIRTKIQPIG